MNSTLPQAIDQVILRALAKQPDARFDTAGALASAAEPALLSETASGPVSERVDETGTSAPQEESGTFDPPLGGVRVIEVRSGRTEFHIGGETYVTGAAGTRCYHDLVKQLGTSETSKILGAAPGFMAKVREFYPGARKPQLRAGEADVVVEALLLAAGVPEPAVARLAKDYRSGRDASVDLKAFRSRA